MTAPSKRTAVLVTRGNHPDGGKPEDPDAIKTFSFNSGMLQNLASIAPGNGGFRTAPFGFSSERALGLRLDRAWQNKLYVYKLDDATGLARGPSFIKETMTDPQGKK